MREREAKALSDRALTPQSHLPHGNKEPISFLPLRCPVLDRMDKRYQAIRRAAEDLGVKK